MLSVLSSVNYEAWFALAEFVDNSLQSFLDYSDALKALHGESFKLRVSIELNPADGGKITVRDNAAGIHEADYERAFRPAAIPLNRSGLSEFGMGMKSAACWFAQNWSVRTCALGEAVERTVHFDIHTIVQEEQEELKVMKRSVLGTKHYTEIVLTNLNRLPQGRTIGKVKEHLGSIFRTFIREDLLHLTFNGEKLSYEQPSILIAPYFRDAEGGVRQWHKEVDLDLGLGLRASGFAALREIASTSDAGFALLRRGRLIQGSREAGYRPEYIFGKPNSYAYQRLFGELHLEGFEVSHTKDGFRWEEHEEVFLQLLKEEINKSSMPLLSQAEGYRVRPRLTNIRSVAETATNRTAAVIEREVPPVLEDLEDLPPSAEVTTTLPVVVTASRRVIDVELHGVQWRIVLELSDDPAIGDWVELSDQLAAENTGALASRRQIGVRISLAHPFMVRFAGADGEHIEPLLRVAAAIGLAETAARDTQVRYAGTIRRNINQLLRDAFSKP